MVRLGRYELIRRIGVGGMAEVFLARRRGPGGVEKRLVVKRIRPERSRDPRFLDLFVHEAELSMSLSHENVVPMFDFGRAGDELFLVMDYIDGPNLGALIREADRQNQRMPPLLVAHIGFELCSGLTHAHSATVATRDDVGIVHCDVTPQNVLLSRAGEVKLADFGVAAVLGGGDGKMRGTPAYMAPEQARGADASARADIFCLGVVLWEALHSRRAREGDAEAVLELARIGAVPACDDFVPDELRIAVERATAIDPDQRYSSALEFGSALDAFVLKTRAAADDKRPVSRQLATYLEALFASALPTQAGTLRVPEGPVSTFLEDGISGLLGDSSTARSIAPTEVDPMGQTDDVRPEVPASGAEATGSSAGEAPRDAVAPSPAATRRRRLTAAGLVIAGIAAGAVAYLAVAGGGARARDGATVRVAHEDGVIAADASASASVEVDAGRLAEATARAADAAPARAEDAAAAPAAKRLRLDAAGPRAGRERGTVLVQATPWARVTVKGHTAHCGETPCTLQLPAGSHTLELENPVTGQSGSLQVDVRAGEQSRVSTVLR